MSSLLSFIFLNFGDDSAVTHTLLIVLIGDDLILQVVCCRCLGFGVS
jgi:hypothetical protein